MTDSTTLGTDEHLGDGGIHLTNKESQSLRRARIAKSAATVVGQADIVAEVPRLTQPEMIYIHRQLKLRAGAPLAAMARAIRSMLARADDEHAAWILHDCFHWPVLATAAASDLTENELAAVLRADLDELPQVLESLHATKLYERLLDIENFGSTATVRAAVWSSMAAMGHAGSTAALGWLIADPPTFWSETQINAAEQVWVSVRKRYPLLPEIPVPLATLVDAVSTLDVLETDGETRTDLPEATMALGPDAEAWLEHRMADLAAWVTTDEDAQLSATDPASVLAELEAEGERVEQERQAIATEILPTLVRAIDGGIPPETHGIARIARFHASLTRLLDAAADVNGGQRAVCLEEALAAVERARSAAAEADATATKLQQIRRLATLAGPEFIADDIAQVGLLAATVTPDTAAETLAGLAALLELIELAGSEQQRAAELGRTISAAVPSAIPLLMFAGTPGTFTIGDTTGSEAASAGPMEVEGVSTHSVQQGSPDCSAAQNVGTDQPAEVSDAEKVTAHQPEPTLDDVLARLHLTVPISASPRSTAVDAAPPSDTLSDPDFASAGAGAVQGLDPVTLYSELLHSGQLSLAYWLTVAQDADPSIQAAHRLAALAAAMKTSTGSPAAAFASTVTHLDPDDLKDHPGAQMLVYGASVRAGLLSPITGASDPLRYATTSVVRSGSAVGELTEALLSAFYAGVYLTPRSANAIAEAAEAESEHDALARAAAIMLENAPNRTIRYGPATELWQTWMAPEDGYLGKPLSIVASGALSPTEMAFVRARIADLRSPRSLEQALDRSAASARGTKWNAKRIEARARDKLLEWAGDVTELLAEWVTATENLSPSGGGTWMTDPIADLRAKVALVREQALLELAQVGNTGREAHDAAADAGLALLNDALDLLVGTSSVAGQEFSAERVLGGLLTLAPDVELTPAMMPRRPLTIDNVATAFNAIHLDDSGWSSAFELRAGRHDQVGTQLLIDTLRPLRPQLAQRLSVMRDEAVDASIAQVDTKAAALAASIDSDRLFGRLIVDQWTDLSTRVRAYQPGHRGTRSDFDVMIEDLDAIEAARAEFVKTAITAARDALATTEMPEDALDRTRRCIDNGDLTTAAEYVVTVRSGGRLPDPREAIDHLHRFYNSFPDAFVHSRPGIGDSAHPMLTQMRNALEASRPTAEIPAGPLAEALAFSEIKLEQVGRGKTAATRIEQWTILAQARSFDARINNVKSILEQIGFVFNKSTNAPGRRGHTGGRNSWLDLYGVRATSGEALLPAFGSGMSPSGDSLRLMGVWRGPTPRELVEMLSEEPSDHSVIVLYFGVLDAGARRELGRVFRSDRRLPTTIVIDDSAFAYLSCQAEPSREITMSALLPFTSSSPFTPDVPGASIRREMFYGRSDERAKIIDMMGPCIVYGGRQLGKSALLLEAAREFDDGHNRHAIYESIFKIGRAVPVDAVWTTLWPLLAARDIVPQDIPAGAVGEALTRHVTKWISTRPGRQLLLLLDESDKFLDGDAEAVNGMFTHVTHFKELMERTGRAVKVVFAGLHQTARFDRLANHPLAHFGEPVCVGPLAPQAAYDLLTRPLHALGYRFADRDHAARVLALANNQPALIQLFAAQLLRNLQAGPMPDDAPPQTVNADDVDRVWADPGLRTSFRKRFDWTLDLDPRYKIIAYSVALQAHARGIETTMTPSELRAECETWWPAGFSSEGVRTGEFRALLDECVDLGVLSYTNRGYRLRTPNVLDLLGTSEEVDAVLDQAPSIELPESFDGSLMRPVFGDGPTRGPLTSQQIADLLAARSQVRLIVGSTALTIERCLKALQDENGRAVSGHRESVMREATSATLVKVCQQVTLKAAGRHAIVILDLRNATAPVATATWSQARELIATHSGGTLGIVLVSSPAQASMWPAAGREADTSSGLTELRRYDRTDLRLWLTETTLPFQDNAARVELLEVTGGWPIQLNKLAEDLTGNDRSLRADPLVDMRPPFTDIEHARELVEATGVRADATLSQAWDFLVQTVSDARADLHTLAEYLTLHGDSGEDSSDALSPAAMIDAGYAGMADVLEVLRALGVLIGLPEDGQFQLEPVVAAATRCVYG